MTTSYEYANAWAPNGAESEMRLRQLGEQGYRVVPGIVLYGNRLLLERTIEEDV